MFNKIVISKLRSSELVRLIDISTVRSEPTLSEINQIIGMTKEYQFICVFSMPFMLPYMFSGLKGIERVGIGGIVGFPSGGDTTE